MNTYQEKAYDTAIYAPVIEYPFSSLAEEAGEVLGKLNKYMRKNGIPMGDAVLVACDPHTEAERTLRLAVIKELGDIQWQLAACCTELGITLEELQADNLAKLADRSKRGVLEGSGDDR